VADRTPTPKETPKAAEAFAAYVALGPKRSLRRLADEYVTQNRYKTTATAFNSLRDWSRIHGWQERLREAAEARSSAMLDEAADLNTETYLAICREYHERIRDEMAAAWKVGDLHPLFDRVKPAPKASATVEHKHTGEVRHTYDLSRLSEYELANLRALAEKYETEGAPV